MLCRWSLSLMKLVGLNDACLDCAENSFGRVAAAMVRAERTIPRASRVPTNHKSGAFRHGPLRFVSTAMKEARIYLD
jgi:hypothetical protein